MNLSPLLVRISRDYVVRIGEESISLDTSGMNGAEIDARFASLGEAVRDAAQGDSRRRAVLELAPQGGLMALRWVCRVLRKEGVERLTFARPSGTPPATTPQDRLMEVILRLAVHATNWELCVSLESFFEGNESLGSIGPNLGDDQPTPDVFYRVLRAVRARPNVQDVLVRIWDEDGGGWPFTDCVWVITDAPLADIATWTASLHPDDPVENPGVADAAGMPQVEKGKRIVSVWWD